MRLLQLVVVASILAPCAAHAQAELGCAGDAEPPARSWAISGLVAAEALPYTGGDLSRREGDPGDAGVHLWPRSARIALCGRIPLRRGALLYNFGYEPWSSSERAHLDAPVWGRILAAELAYPIVRWLVVRAGVQRLAFAHGHDEPEQSLPLPVRSAITNSVAPDRRLGLSLDDDWGAVRVRLGLYASARTLDQLPDSGILFALRAVMEPIGPVGNRLSTLADEPYWRRRFRFGLDFSGMVEAALKDGVDRAFAIGIDVPMKWGPLGFVAEVLYAKNALELAPTVTPGGRYDRVGVTAQLAWMMWRPYLELEARYEWFHAPELERQQFHAVTAGLTGYLYKTYLKAQLAYGHKFHYAGPAVRDDYLLIVLQAAQ